ncbi:MAG: GNAT family N-acetyltransferase [Acidimicrobiales bacterium]
MTTLAVEDDGAICSFATAGPSRDADMARAGELYAIYVDPRQRGRRVGRALMVDARSRRAEEGHDEALLWVLVGNERAERFYRMDRRRGWASRRRTPVTKGYAP